jgi:hypothetical protein
MSNATSEIEKFSMPILVLKDRVLDFLVQEEKTIDCIKNAKTEKLKQTFERALENIRKWKSEISEAIEILEKAQ